MIVYCPHCQKAINVILDIPKVPWNPKPRYVQVYNPVGKHWVKLDRKYGGIVSYKKSPGPYKMVVKYDDLSEEEKRC